MRARTVLQKPLPASVGGWNTKDSYETMEPQYALVCENLIPGASDLKLRKGHQKHSTFAETNAIESMYVHQEVTGVSRLLSCVKIGGVGNIFNATPGDVGGGEILLKTNLNVNCQWSWATLDGITVGVNGFDQPQKFTIASGISDTIFTHVSLSNDDLLIHVTNFRGRLYLVEKNTSNLYYGGDGAIAGALTQFPVGKLLAKGGNVLFTAVWSGETGQGIDDYLLVASSNGELLAFTGAFPGDSSWSLVGRFYLGDFLSRRSYFKVAGDVLLMTQGGLFPFSQILKLGESSNYSSANLAANIFPSWTEVARINVGDWRWCAIEVPFEDWFLINVPISSIRVDQFIMNSKTGAWARFLGWNASSWAKLGSVLYLGGQDGVGHIWEANKGQDDNGNLIYWKLQTAFNFLETPETNKRFIEVTPLFNSAGVAEISLGSAVNYDLKQINAYKIAIDADYGLIYDVGEYDVDVYGDGSTTFDRTYGLIDSGFNISMHLFGGTSSFDFALSGFRVSFLPGGFR